jgi:hypothetical protein
MPASLTRRGLIVGIAGATAATLRHGASADEPGTSTAFGPWEDFSFALLQEKAKALASESFMPSRLLASTIL